jgi:hypothetical protein
MSALGGQQSRPARVRTLRASSSEAGPSYGSALAAWSSRFGRVGWPAAGSGARAARTSTAKCCDVDHISEASLPKGQDAAGRIGADSRFRIGRKPSVASNRATWAAWSPESRNSAVTNGLGTRLFRGRRIRMAQQMVSWFVSDGRYRVHAINAVGRRRGRIVEVEEVDTGERFHGSARRMKRLVDTLRVSSGDFGHDGVWTPDSNL